MTEALTQIDIDALWLACNVEISAVWPREKRMEAQLRVQRLNSAGVIEHGPGQPPQLKDQPDAD